jgi:hypothetical protein
MGQSSKQGDVSCPVLKKKIAKTSCTIVPAAVVLKSRKRPDGATVLQASGQVTQKRRFPFSLKQFPGGMPLGAWQY